MEMNKFDKALEFVVLGGFLAVTFGLMHWVVPEANNQLFGQALGALTVIATLVAKALWERNSKEAVLDEKRADNTGKLADAITAAASSTPAPVNDVAAEAAEETADAAVDKAKEIANGNVG